jgi:hypothetical protein
MMKALIRDVFIAGLGIIIGALAVILTSEPHQATKSNISVFPIHPDSA